MKSHSVLKSYDEAFGQFFARLKKDGIDQSNTLFVFTVEEGDHFVGAQPTNPGCDGVTVPCVYPINSTTGEQEIGEFDVDVLGLVLAAGDSTAFSIHEDSAPTVYIHGDPTSANFDPASPDPLARELELTMAPLTAPSPLTGDSENLLAAMADPVEEKLLHMVTPDPLRTPNFTYFGNPDFFFDNSPRPADFCATPPIDSAFVCVDNEFAWNHGDIQPEIATTWLGIVGPGVKQLGQTSQFFSDHTDVRPTILTLLGLRDDYTHDGRVIVEAIDSSALPSSLKADKAHLLALGATYKQLNAPFGQLGMDSLKVSTFALSSSDPSIYLSLEQLIQQWTTERDAIAGPMKAALEGAAFDGQKINGAEADQLIAEGEALLAEVHLAASSL